MTVAELVRGLPGVAVSGPGDGIVLSLAVDSRSAGPGTLFAALPGARTDGARFAADAVTRGAVAVLGRGPAPPTSRRGPRGSPRMRRGRPSAALAKRFFGAPDERLLVVGMTGTNGKTSTTHFLAGALDHAGIPTAIGGTLGQRFGAVTSGPTLTTPEAPQLFGFLAEAERAGARAAALEVSSAALVADRVAGMRFTAAVLTNIGHDHLDLHGTHEAYRAAKRRPVRGARCLGGGGPPGGRRLPEEFGRAARAARRVTFGEAAGADWRISEHRPSAIRGAVPARRPRFRGRGLDPPQRRLGRAEHRRGRRRGGRAGGRPGGGGRGRWRRCRTCRAASSGWRPGSPSRRSWTTPTPPRRSSACWRCCAA